MQYWKKKKEKPEVQMLSWNYSEIKICEMEKCHIFY